MDRVEIKVYPVFGGVVSGPALVSSQPLSFWGGINPESGLIIDRKNELHGESVSGKILVFPYSKGSVSGTTVLLELVRRGKHPYAIINLETEPLIAVGAVLAERLYGERIPIVDKPVKNLFALIRTGDYVKVDGYLGLVIIYRDKIKL